MTRRHIPLEPDGAVKATVPGPEANKQTWPVQPDRIHKGDLYDLPEGKKRKISK